MSPKIREKLFALSAGLAAGVRAALDFLLPPLCARCDTRVAREQTLCVECWKAIRFIAPPLCARCGAPFDLPVEGETLCGACLEKAPRYTAARSVFLYDDESRALILRFKHGDQVQALPLYARWLAGAGAAFLQEADMIVPVPLHPWRLLLRRYNQSALLAQALGHETGKPVIVDALLRTRATRTQGHLTKDERRRNVLKAFAVKKGVCVKDKAIVLVDDVLTSGATVSECARTLRRAGASRVHVLTLARVRAGT